MVQTTPDPIWANVLVVGKILHVQKRVCCKYKTNFATSLELWSGHLATLWKQIELLNSFAYLWSSSSSKSLEADEPSSSQRSPHCSILKGCLPFSLLHALWIRLLRQMAWAVDGSDAGRTEPTQLQQHTSNLYRYVSLFCSLQGLSEQCPPFCSETYWEMCYYWPKALCSRSTALITTSIWFSAQLCTE